MYDFPDYEEGTLGMDVPVRKKWWQWWLPKTVYVTYATYQRIDTETYYVLHGHGTVVEQRIKK